MQQSLFDYPSGPHPIPAVSIFSYSNNVVFVGPR